MNGHISKIKTTKSTTMSTMSNMSTLSIRQTMSLQIQTRANCFGGRKEEEEELQDGELDSHLKTSSLYAANDSFTVRMIIPFPVLMPYIYFRFMLILNQAVISKVVYHFRFYDGLLVHKVWVFCSRFGNSCVWFSLDISFFACWLPTLGLTLVCFLGLMAV